MYSVVSRCVDKKQLERVLFVAALGLLIGVPGSVGAMETKIEEKTNALAKLLEDPKFAECSQGKFPKLEEKEVEIVKEEIEKVKKERQDDILQGGDYEDWLDTDEAIEKLADVIDEKNDQKTKAEALIGYSKLMKNSDAPSTYESRFFHKKN